MDPALPSSCRRNARRDASSWLVWLGVIAVIGIVAAIIFPAGAQCGPSVPHSIEGTNLRTIGQAIIAADTDHPGMLYDANLPDIYAFAAQLARAGLNDPKIWLSKIDPNFPMPANLPASILLTKPVANGKRPINVEFRGAPIAFAIAIFPSGTLLSSLPPTTPLAWTRGLLPYGTWSKNLSPYGEWGGFIVFNGGNLERYQEIENKLTSFAGKPTSNILETLPPGTRILQFTPKR